MPEPVDTTRCRSLSMTYPQGTVGSPSARTQAYHEHDDRQMVCVNSLLYLETEAGGVWAAFSLPIPSHCKAEARRKTCRHGRATVMFRGERRQADRSRKWPAQTQPRHVG